MLIQNADNIDSGGTEHDVFLFTNSETPYTTPQNRREERRALLANLFVVIMSRYPYQEMIPSRSSPKSPRLIPLFCFTTWYYVIKRTKDDAYGHPQEKATPAQYLQRLDHFNIVFPELAMQVIGVSLNERGFGVIWTKQPYVKGEALDDPKDLIEIVKGHGWIKGEGNTYKHGKTGVMISDANIGNILIDANGYPQLFDVVVEELGTFYEQPEVR